MRYQHLLIGSITILLGVMLCGEAYDSLAATTQAGHTIGPPQLEAIRGLAELTILEVEATEIVSAEVTGYTGGTSVVMLVRGTVTLGVDLEQAKIIEVDEDRRRVVLGLPPPEVRRVMIHHEDARVLSCERRGLWRIAVGQAKEDQAIKEVLAVGQDRLMQAASLENNIDQARMHAETTIGKFLSDTGWELNVQWKEQ